MDLEALYKEERRLLELLTKADPIFDKEYEEDLKKEIGRINEMMQYLEEKVH